MTEIQGNCKGLKNSVLQELEALYEITVTQDEIISSVLVHKMLLLSAKIKREISLYLDRGGTVQSIAVGTPDSVELPAIKTRKNADRLSGLRCIHTHLNNDSTLSPLDISALLRNHFDAVVALAEGENQQLIFSFGIITGRTALGELTVSEEGPCGEEMLAEINFANLRKILDRYLQKEETASTKNIIEKAVLVGVEFGKKDLLWSTEESLEELKQLADTAGAEVAAIFCQKKQRPDAAYYIGKGKVAEIAAYIQVHDIDLCIFDDELSPAQLRNLELALGARIIDRTGLILDIFAQRARSNEGKMQVELAQLQYSLPHLSGKGVNLSRLGGGIGTRGPGETKLEMDRRKIKERIALITTAISRIASGRTTNKAARRKRQITTLALVGYTNAGKSTLLNTLTASDIYVQDQLFATLDPTTRQLELPNKQEAVLTDTVGFIQRLPHQLVKAFKSTLEEVCDADLLLHVVDISQVTYKKQMESVYKVLKELGAAAKRMIIVYNKVDKITDEALREQMLAKIGPENNSVVISAKQGRGLDELLALITENLNLQFVKTSLFFGYEDSAIAAKLHEVAAVHSQEYEERGILITADLTKEQREIYRKYLWEA